ncbi:MAG: hypothetical protein E6J50_02095 [Chloroflexi bacterium]|nr:MAG: hypothetical protein E6J50_02095 [Chloroflexota bacterium]
MDDQALAKDPSAFYALVGRALTDKKFRERIMDQDHPDAQLLALGEVGITGNDQILAELNNSIDAVNKLAGAGGFSADVAAVT